MPRLLLLATILALGGAARRAAAQAIAPAGAVPAHAAVMARPYAPALVAASRPPRAWPYVAGGALVGALATVGGLALYAAQADGEGLMSPFALAPAILGGTALGAGAGYLVYRVRF